MISFLKVTVTSTIFVGCWDLLPKLAIPDDKGHDLTISAAHDRPSPAFVPPFIGF